MPSPKKNKCPRCDKPKAHYGSGKRMGYCLEHERVNAAKCMSSFEKRHPTYEQDRPKRTYPYRPWIYHESQMVKRYGLTLDDYDRMFAIQNGVCAICRRPSRNDKRLHIDHDHATGKVRGLLCDSCNNGLGRFRDDPMALRAAADYLEKGR